MSKITKNQRISTLERQLSALITLVKMKGYNEPEPQLKQLDQSVFDGLDEKWRFAAVDSNGDAVKYTLRVEPYIKVGQFVLNDNLATEFSHELIGENYDASNWKNSLIERDIAKELLEVDLSSELTGSELCRAMLARGDEYVMCLVSDSSQEDTLLDGYSAAISSITYNECFYGYDFTWQYAIPINNQGEPLTASEVGL